MGVRKRVVRWAVVAVAVPLAANVADRVGRRLEAGRGPTRWSRRLRTGAERLRRLQGGRRRR